MDWWGRDRGGGVDEKEVKGGCRDEGGRMGS